MYENKACILSHYMNCGHEHTFNLAYLIPVGVRWDRVTGNPRTPTHGLHCGF